MFIFTLFLIIIIGLISSLVYYKFKVNFKIWDQLKIINLPPTIPCGNFPELVSRGAPHFSICFKNLYNKLKIASKSKRSSDYGHDQEHNEFNNTDAGINYDCAGIYIFNQPFLFPIGPEFVKQLLVRDFNSFVNRGAYYNPRDDPLSCNIFFTENDEWKSARQKLSFAFTSGKMKLMFETLNEVGSHLVEYILNSDFIKQDACNIKELMAGFTTDVVSSCIFGLQSNSITNPNSEFRHYSKKVINWSFVKVLAIFLATTFPKQAKKLRFRVFDNESTQFFNKIVKDTITYRTENGIKRKDLMQILIEMMSSSLSSQEIEKETLSFDEIVANAFIFFFAGFETSSTSLSVTLYYLALNPEYQESVRKEINKVLSTESLNYDSFNEMHLLDRIVHESLRMHPPIAFLNRMANKPYQLPNGSIIPEGTPVIISTLGLHYDPDIWPEPEKFNPNRFTHEECQKRHSFSYLPFGEGNRICIGQRFAIMQIKVGLIKILRNFKVEISRKTDIPLKIDKISATYVPKDLWLKMSKLNKDELLSTEL